MTEVPRAVVLLSGGLDSATCLLIARSEGFAVYALSFDYGQRHAIELERACDLAARYGAREHRVLRLELPALGPASLELTVSSVTVFVLSSFSSSTSITTGCSMKSENFLMIWRRR